ncbi:hypothetical protein QBC45DRAFT_448928 [Copromyces sp. CBS 386.78]|nr:hypothetical protein QBC45DRAFT_448928 [Copromyces sp. CBS 386.78]
MYPGAAGVLKANVRGTGAGAGSPSPARARGTRDRFCINYAFVSIFSLHKLTLQTFINGTHVVFREALFGPLERDKCHCALMAQRKGEHNHGQEVGMGLKIVWCIELSLTRTEAKSSRSRKAQCRGTKPAPRGS